jgi:hypothetical protein
MVACWDLLGREYTDPKALEQLGTVKIDDEEIQITNDMMRAVVHFIAFLREYDRDISVLDQRRLQDYRESYEREKRMRTFAEMNDKQVARKLLAHLDYLDEQYPEDRGLVEDGGLVRIAAKRLENQ